jgi:hypothetical protein
LKTVLHALFLAAISCIGCNAHAEHSVCALPAFVTVEGKSLPLVGAGNRTYWFRTINTVALYANGAPETWSALKASRDPIQVNVIFHSARFTREQFHESWKERFQATLSPEEHARHAEQISALLALFVDAKRGDTLRFTIAANQLKLALNEKILGNVGDHAFGLVVIAGWLGDAPADEALRQKLFSGQQSPDGIPCAR